MSLKSLFCATAATAMFACSGHVSADNLEKLNDDPYDEGWIIKVKVTDEASIPSLMDQPAYDKQCSEAG